MFWGRGRSSFRDHRYRRKSRKYCNIAIKKMPKSTKFERSYGKIFGKRIKKQVSKVNLSEEESKSDHAIRIGVAPLTDSGATENNGIAETELNIEIENASDRSPPRSPWPLSALFDRRKWHRFRSGIVEHLHRRPSSPFQSFGFHRNESNGSREGKEELSVKISDDTDQRDNAIDFAKSPLHKFNLCRPTYYSSNIRDRLTEAELNERREFIVVVAASLQKFGAATHLTEAFTDAVAKVSCPRP